MKMVHDIIITVVRGDSKSHLIYSF